MCTSQIERTKQTVCLLIISADLPKIIPCIAGVFSKNGRGRNLRFEDPLGQEDILAYYPLILPYLAPS
jgi:hypothetical protein